MKGLSTMMGYFGGMGWGGWLGMSLAMVAFWGLVILVVIAIFRGTGRDATPVDRAERRDSERVLDERFARGEIGVEEYQARRGVLRGTDR